MVQIDPKGWLIKELDFEKSDEENLFQLEHASCVVCRLKAARRWPSRPMRPGSRRPCHRPGRRRNRVTARTALVILIAGGEEGFGRRRMRTPGGSSGAGAARRRAYRAALLEAAKDPEARVRVAAIRGLARLKHDAAGRVRPPRRLVEPRGSLRRTPRGTPRPRRPGRSRTPTSS